MARGMGCLALLVVAFLVIVAVRSGGSSSGQVTPTPNPAMAPLAQTVAVTPPPTPRGQPPTAVPLTATPATPVLLATLDQQWSNGSWSEAITTLRSLQKVAPDALDYQDKLYVANFNLGNQRLEGGDLAGAAKAFSAADQVDPSRGEAKSALVALTPTSVPADRSAVAALLSDTVDHYEQLLDDGKAALGPTQYNTPQEGLLALQNPTSAAAKFSAWQVKVHPGGDMSYIQTFQQAQKLMGDGDDLGVLNRWLAHIDNVRAAMDQWVGVATNWQIRKATSQQLASAESTVRSAITTARADVDALR